MPADVAVVVDLLRGGKEGRLRVRVVARVEVGEREADGEGRVGREHSAVGRERELGGRHVRRRREHAHGRGVAGARVDLLAVGERELGHRQAEVDEVVGRRERGDLSCVRGPVVAFIVSTLPTGILRGQLGCATHWFCPSSSNPVAITSSDSVREDCGSLVPGSGLVLLPDVVPLALAVLVCTGLATEVAEPASGG